MIVNRLVTTGLFLFVLAGLTRAQTPISNDCSMGLWPWLVKNVNSDIPKIIAATKAVNMETIYVSVFRVQGNCTGNLPMEDESGRWQAKWGTTTNYLKLSSLISQAHAAGLQVVGVMSCFKSGSDPKDMVHRQYLLDIIGYFMEHFRPDGTPFYDLDGMCLDYVRFTSGLSRDPKYVNSFLDSIKVRFPYIPLHAYVIANSYSYDGPVYDNNFKSYSTVINTISSGFGQNYEQMASRLDVILPMTYQSSGGVYGSNYTYMKGYAKKVAEYVRRAMTIGGSPYTKVIPAIKTYGTANTQSVAASCEGVMEGGAHGYSTFRYYTASPTYSSVLAKYAAPGTNRPVASLSAGSLGQTFHLDPTKSKDGQDPLAKLRFRYDLDGDGKMDTGYLVGGIHDYLAPQPGTRVVAMEVSDSEGHKAITRREVYIQNSLGLTFPMLSVTNGGKLGLPCKLGPGGKGKFFVTLASLSGTTPGMPLTPNLTLPLVYDSMTWVSIFMAGTSIFPGSFGTVPASGDITPAFFPGPGILPKELAGYKVNFALVIFNGSNYTPEAVTNPVTISLVQ